MLQALALGLIGFLGAVINTLAGGGTFLVVPALILMGFGPLTANATNRLSLVAQGLGATAHYQRQGRLDLPLALRLSVVASVGAAAGAYGASLLGQRDFGRVLAVLMLGALLFFLFQPARWFEARAGSGRSRPFLTTVSFILIGLYGGFFGAGIGVFILLVLSATQRMTLVSGNAVKSAVVLIFSVAASVVFVRQGLVDYGALIPLAVGNLVGGWVGARLSLRAGDVWIRRSLVLVVLASLFKLFAPGGVQ